MNLDRYHKYLTEKAKREHRRFWKLCGCSFCMVCGCIFLIEMGLALWPYPANENDNFPLPLQADIAVEMVSPAEDKLIQQRWKTGSLLVPEKLDPIRSPKLNMAAIPHLETPPILPLRRRGKLTQQNSKSTIWMKKDKIQKEAQAVTAVSAQTEQVSPISPWQDPSYLADAEKQRISWQTQVQNRLEAFKRYPAFAHGKQQVSVASVVFSLDYTGQLLNLALSRSSGYDDLDNEALLLFKRANPFPPPPSILLIGNIVTLSVPISFTFDK